MTTDMTPPELAAAIGKGLLTFPVTHFDADHRFDEDGFRAHCDWLLGHDVAALFAAGGTGEFFSLAPHEVEWVVRAAVEETQGRVPVIAGCGYGTAMAVDMARAAKAAGADGLLLLPPYLTEAGQAGLTRHVVAVCEAVPDLAVIQYNRANAVMNADSVATVAERCANFVGFKDGVGDLELMMRVCARMGDRLTYIGGLPTAETFAAAYLEMGVTTYSSAIFNFLPEWALGFYAAVRARDGARVAAEFNRFVAPYLDIRDRGRGYAVSIVKAGMRAVARPAGPVRLPLTDLDAAEQAELDALVASVATARG